MFGFSKDDKLKKLIMKECKDQSGIYKKGVSCLAGKTEMPEDELNYIVITSRKEYFTAVNNAVIKGITKDISLINTYASFVEDPTILDEDYNFSENVASAGELYRILKFLMSSPISYDRDHFWVFDGWKNGLASYLSHYQVKIMNEVLNSLS